MKRLTLRQRVLVGALVGAGLIGGVDWLTRGGPAPAAAGQDGEGETSGALSGWVGIDEAVARLTTTGYVSVAGDISKLGRDLFRPTPLINGAFREPMMAPSAPPSEIEQQKVGQPVAFSDQHTLSGVVTGAVPLAVVDDRVLPLHGRLDGHVLVEVQRDCVVFEASATGERVRLRLEVGPKTSGPAASETPSPPAPPVDPAEVAE